MTIGEWIELAEARLRAKRVESPRLEAQLLAAHVEGRQRSWVLAHPEGEFQELAGELLLQRREAHEPLAYLLGKREFFCREFEVGAGVLVPRQETETLVETAILLAKTETGLRTCLDLGTGSGCIAITIALETNMSLTASDVSAKALEYAERNAQRHGASLELVKSRWCDSLLGKEFDLIVTNPPYVRQDEDIMPEASSYEPGLALYGGSDGLDAYRAIAREALKITHPLSWLLLETGKGMGESVKAEFLLGGWDFVRSVEDLSGIERVLVFRRTP